MEQICVNASCANMFKNKVDIYLRRAGYTLMAKRNLDKPTASLSTCHIGLCLSFLLNRVYFGI